MVAASVSRPMQISSRYRLSRYITVSKDGVSHARGSLYAKTKPDRVVYSSVNVARRHRIADAVEHETTIPADFRKNIASVDKPAVVDGAIIFRQRFQQR